MKKYLLVTFAIITLSHANEDGPKPIAVETDHGENQSDVSTDELVIRYDDGSAKNLTKNSLMERVPALSHDNSLVAFLRRIDSNMDGQVNWDDDTELWLMKLDNRSEARVPGNFTGCTESSWHPSELKLAFIASEANQSKLFIYDYSNKKLDPIYIGARSWPAWSPDGKNIAFYDVGNRVLIYDMETHQVNVLSNDVGHGWSLMWSYNNKLFFVQNNRKNRYMYDPASQIGKIVSENDFTDVIYVDQKMFNWAKKIGPK